MFVGQFSACLISNNILINRAATVTLPMHLPVPSNSQQNDKVISTKYMYFIISHKINSNQLKKI